MPKTDEKKEEAPAKKKQSLKDGQAAFAKVIEAANKMRRTAKLTSIGSALGAFANIHGVEEANKMHKEHKLAGEGIHRVSAPSKK